MNIKVKDFISTNNNPLIQWKIDGYIYQSREYIHENLFEAYVCDWSVDLWDGIIEISTEYGY